MHVLVYFLGFVIVPACFCAPARMNKRVFLDTLDSLGELSPAQIEILIMGLIGPFIDKKTCDEACVSLASTVPVLSHFSDGVCQKACKELKHTMNRAV